MTDKPNTFLAPSAQITSEPVGDGSGGTPPTTPYPKPDISTAAVELKTISQIRDRLLTQDNRATAYPMFCVEGRRRIYGMDPKFTDDVIWIDTEDGVHEVDAPADEEETDTVIRSGYVDVWETLMVAFTEAGCAEHLVLNGHNYRHYKEVRIYVESFRRCPEMIAIRKMLMSPLCADRDAKADLQHPEVHDRLNDGSADIPISGCDPVVAGICGPKCGNILHFHSPACAHVQSAISGKHGPCNCPTRHIAAAIRAKEEAEKRLQEVSFGGCSCHSGFIGEHGKHCPISLEAQLSAATKRAEEQAKRIAELEGAK